MIAPCGEEMKNRILEYLEERFGLEAAVFADYELYETGGHRVVLGPPVDLDIAVDSAGIHIARVQNSVKPTTNLFQLFGRHVTGNVVRLTREHLPQYCAGKDIELSTEEISGATRGFVMVAWGDLPLGCGFLRANTLESQVPKANRLNLSHY